MKEGLYPLTEERFKELVQPIIERNDIWKGRPPKIIHYQAFCAILYILRTGTPWRDLPASLANGIRSILVLIEAMKREYGGKYSLNYKRRKR